MPHRVDVVDADRARSTTRGIRLLLSLAYAVPVVAAAATLVAAGRGPAARPDSSAAHAMTIQSSTPGTSPRPEIRVRATEDFAVNGRGDHAAWQSVEWTPLHARHGVTDAYATRFKVLYSSRGLYVLIDGADKTLTATLDKDFANLWTEDVFEVFLWTDERDPVYFEYEISPLDKELPIIVPNFDGTFHGWLPWHYEGERRTQKAVTIAGGPQKPGATIESWRAEVVIPYALLRPLRNVPPTKGMRWRANFYRIDHDRGKDQSIQWDWSRVGKTFHDYKNFGTLVFD